MWIKRDFDLEKTGSFIKKIKTKHWFEKKKKIQQTKKQNKKTEQKTICLAAALS